MKDRIADNVSDLVSEFAPFLSDNDSSFVRRVFARGIDAYRERIDLAGFRGLGNVLDAGCGYGQWTLALAERNDSVTALDIDGLRLLFVQELVSRLDIRGVDIARGKVWQSELPEQSYDGVFCFGVLFITPWRQTLAEFARLLRPGGRLYVNANGIGWYKHLWRTSHNATADYDPREIAAGVLQNTLGYERGTITEPNGHVLIEPAELEAELHALGFRILGHGADGTVSTAGDDERCSVRFFEPEYEGDLGVYEVLAEKAI